MGVTRYKLFKTNVSVNEPADTCSCLYIGRGTHVRGHWQGMFCQAVAR